MRKQAEVPRFLRTAWDEGSASAFGPWRISPRVDPLDPAGADAELVTAAALAGAAALPDVMEAAPTESLDSPPVPEGLHNDADLQAAKDQAYARGLQAGQTQVRTEVEAERTRERELLRHLGIELRGLNEDPQRFFEPLKRLALHLAEQLVRAELQLSGQAVSQLVRQSLARLDQPADKAVVSLNPVDLERLQAMGPEATQGLQLEPDPHLSQGSVRVRVNETVVQDLIEHRLEALARPLLREADAWLAQSTLLHPRPFQPEMSEIEDVLPRPAPPPEEPTP